MQKQNCTVFSGCSFQKKKKKRNYDKLSTLERTLLTFRFSGNFSNRPPCFVHLIACLFPLCKWIETAQVWNLQMKRHCMKAVVIRRKLHAIFLLFNLTFQPHISVNVKRSLFGFTLHFLSCPFLTAKRDLTALRGNFPAGWAEKIIMTSFFSVFFFFFFFWRLFCAVPCPALSSHSRCLKSNGSGKSGTPAPLWVHQDWLGNSFFWRFADAQLLYYIQQQWSRLTSQFPISTHSPPYNNSHFTPHITIITHPPLLLPWPLDPTCHIT